MLKMADIESRILEDWQGESLPLHLFRAILGLQPASRSYLTLSLLRGLLGSSSGITTLQRRAVVSEIAQWLSEPDIALKDVYRSAEYLASERIGILQSGFQFVRDDDSLVLLDDEHVGDALATGRFFDPDTGHEVHDWRSRVVIFYKPSPLLSEMADGR